MAHLDGTDIAPLAKEVAKRCFGNVGRQILHTQIGSERIAEVSRADLLSLQSCESGYMWSVKKCADVHANIFKLYR